MDAQTATARYESLMEIIRSRHTSRAFKPDYVVPKEHYDMILEAAQHSPSGADAQPWHFIVVTDPAIKAKLGDYFVAEARRRAKLKMKFPTPNYAGMKTPTSVRPRARSTSGSAPPATRSCSRTNRRSTERATGQTI